MSFNNIKFLSLKNFIIYILTLFYIIFVFVNFTHNSYQQTVPQSPKQNEILKYKVSKKLSSNETYKLYFNRECKITGSMEDRKPTRWIKVLALKTVYQQSFKINNLSPYYLDIIIHSLLIFFTLALIYKTFSIDKKYIFLYLLFITFTFQQHLGEYSFSVFEMFFLALAIYASKNKNFFLFLISSTLALLNRDSGILILFTWLIFNDSYKKFIILGLLTIIPYLIFNFDMIPCLLNPKFIVPMEYQEGQTNFTSLLSINFPSALKLILINFIIPFGIGFYFYAQSEIKNKYLLGAFLLYLFVFMFGAPIHHSAIRLILLPLIFTFIYFSEEKKI